MIHIPERYSYCELYLTLRCNFNCSYCINSHTGVDRKRKEMTAKEWIIGIDNIDTTLPITLGGGEPTIYPGFYDIISGTKQLIRFDLLTNGFGFNVDEFIEKAPANRFTQKGPEYKSIRMSYHPKTTDPENLIKTAVKLQDSGYCVGIFSINHPENLKANVEMTEKCRASGIYFFIRDFLGYYDDILYGTYSHRTGLNGNRKRCMCRTEEMLVGPCGSVYRCHRDLYEGVLPIGHILNMAFDIEDIFRPCDNYGLCNPCDMKRKLGPDLIANKCSVEIMEGQ